MCGSTVSSAPPLTIVVTFFHLPGWHQGLVFLTMRVDAERLQSPIIHSAPSLLPPPPRSPHKFALTVVSKFSWEDCIFRKQYHKIIQNLGGKQTDCIWGDSEIVNWLHLKSSKVMKSWITFLKLWDLLGYFERTASERPTCQKLALWSKLFQRY